MFDVDYSLDLIWELAQRGNIHQLNLSSCCIKFGEVIGDCHYITCPVSFTCLIFISALQNKNIKPLKS